MHLKFGYCVLYTPIYRLTERKKRVHVQNFPCRTVGAKKVMCAGPIVHGKVVVEFGTKVFLVDCLLSKYTLNIAKIRITERAQAFLFTRKQV